MLLRLTVAIVANLRQAVHVFHYGHQKNFLRLICFWVTVKIFQLSGPTAEFIGSFTSNG